MKFAAFMIASVLLTTSLTAQTYPAHLICGGQANFGADLRISGSRSYEGEMGQASESGNAHYDAIGVVEPTPGILLFSCSGSQGFPKYDMKIDTTMINSNGDYEGFVDITYSSSSHRNLIIYCHRI